MFVTLISALSILLSCSQGGNAPTFGYESVSINPNAIIIPKSTSFKISVLAKTFMGVEDNVTLQAACSTNDPVLTIQPNGTLANSFTGTTILRRNLTCVFDGKTATVPVTIVPAVLVGLTLTKTDLLMGPNQSQQIQVYGNFKDDKNYVFALELTDYVTWTSSQTGVSQAVTNRAFSYSAGSANLTASFGGFSASTLVTVSNSQSASVASPKGVGLLGSYYDFITGAPYTGSNIGNPFETLFGQRIDSQVYFNWSNGTNNLGQPLYFGIRWTGRIYIPTTGMYTFYTSTDDGVRLWLGDTTGTPIIDNWTLHASHEDVSAPVSLTAGQYYEIKMDYFENAGYSQAELRWSSDVGITKQLIPQIYLFPN